MGDPTRGGPPHDDPEATQIGAPPEGVVDESGASTGALSADEAATRWAPLDAGAPEPTRLQPTYAAPPTGQAPPRPADGGTLGRSSGMTRAPSGAAGTRPRRRRRARLNLPRLIAPIVFLAAVIAVLSIAVDSGVIGGKKAAKTPAATATGKNTTKASGSSVVKVRKFYRVKAGDTLSVIAEKFHTTENQLMIVNNLSTTTLRVGQRLKLPSPSPVTSAAGTSRG